MGKFKVGDEIIRVSNFTRWAPKGFRSIVLGEDGDLRYTDINGDKNVSLSAGDWEIYVPPEDPIRTVTRRELVPGEYGSVRVWPDSPNGMVRISLTNKVTCGDLSASDLRSAAMVLSQLAEFLDEDKGDE